MKDLEHFEVKESKNFDEYKKYDAFEYYKATEDHTFKEEFKTDENNFNNQTQSIEKETKEEKIDLKKKAEKIIESTSSFTSNVCATICTAAAVVVTCTSLINSPPTTTLNSIDIGSNYVEYDLNLSNLDDETKYYIDISNPSYQYRIDVTGEGNYHEKVTGLNPFTSYNLNLIGFNNDTSGYTTYYSHSFYTLKEDPKVLTITTLSDSLQYDVRLINQDVDYQSLKLIIYCQDEFYRAIPLNSNEETGTIANIPPDEYVFKLYGYVAQQDILIESLTYVVDIPYTPLISDLNVNINYDELYATFITTNPLASFRVELTDLETLSSISTGCSKINDNVSFMFDNLPRKFNIKIYEDDQLIFTTKTYYTLSAIEFAFEKINQNVSVYVQSNLLDVNPEIEFTYYKEGQLITEKVSSSKDINIYIATKDLMYSNMFTFKIIIDDEVIFESEEIILTYNEVLSINHLPNINNLDIEVNLENNFEVKLEVLLCNEENIELNSFIKEYSNTLINETITLTDDVRYYYINICENDNIIYSTDGSYYALYEGPSLKDNYTLDFDYENKQITVNTYNTLTNDFAYNVILTSNSYEQEIIYDSDINDTIIFTNTDLNKQYTLTVEYIRLYNDSYIVYNTEVLEANLEFAKEQLALSTYTYLGNDEYAIAYEFTSPKFTSINSVIVNATQGEETYDAFATVESDVFKFTLPNTFNDFDITLTISFMYNTNEMTVEYLTPYNVKKEMISINEEFVYIPDYGSVYTISFDVTYNNPNYQLEIYETTSDGNTLVPYTTNPLGVISIDTTEGNHEYLLKTIDSTTSLAIEELNVVKQYEVVTTYYEAINMECSCPNPGDGIILTQNEDNTLNMYLLLTSITFPQNSFEKIRIESRNLSENVMYEFRTSSDPFVYFEDIVYDEYNVYYDHCYQPDGKDYYYAIRNPYTPSGAVQFLPYSTLYCTVSTTETVIDIPSYLVYNDPSNEVFIIYNDVYYPATYLTDHFSVTIPNVITDADVLSIKCRISDFSGDNTIYIRELGKSITIFEHYTNYANNQNVTIKGTRYIEITKNNINKSIS